MNVRRYCAAIFLIGCAVVAALSGTAHYGFIATHPWSFVFLTAGVVVGEMLPIRIPRRGNDEEITLSTCFAMALLFAGGLGPALIAQCSASVIQDLVSRKPGFRIRFNLGQYSLSMVAAVLVIRFFLGPVHGHGRMFAGEDLPVVLLAAATFYVVNTVIVGVAVALYQEVPIRRYFRRDWAFVVVTGSVMLFLVPIVIAASAYSVVLIPLFLAPMVAIHNVVWRGSRSEFASRHDGLTGLPNRVAFHDDVQAVIDVDQDDGCVLLLDLDRFKEVNDTLGHRYGDLLLRQVAERFRAQLGEHDQIARLGGDEFAIFGYGYDRNEAEGLAAGLAGSLRTPFELDQIVVDAQTSIGVALFPADGTDVETLLQKADVAMYQAKESHTDVAVYDERRDHHSPAKLALTADLRTAIDGDGIVVWYQPELDLRTEKVLALEALVRWDHPQLGILAPATFLPIAEHTSLIKPLTERVLELALAQMADWRTIDPELAVAVNVSARVLTDDDFTSCVMAALERSTVSPSQLKLEITESALLADPVTARSALQDLTRLGVEISIDDFGTGYSSLAYLADLPVSEVKIDRSFVSRMKHGSRETIIVNSTIDLAHHLGYRAVAEGVEDPALLSELRARGCDAAQGFAISPPLASDDASRWLSAWASQPRPAPVRLSSVA